MEVPDGSDRRSPALKYVPVFVNNGGQGGEALSSPARVGLYARFQILIQVQSSEDLVRTGLISWISICAMNDSPKTHLLDVLL